MQKYRGKKQITESPGEIFFKIPRPVAHSENLVCGVWDEGLGSIF